MFDTALKYIQTHTSVRPQVTVVLGSGLSGFTEELEDRIEIPYAEIPNWPRSTAVGHAGKLVLGRLGQREVAVLAGRAHLYEGYTPSQTVFGVRVMGKLGVRGMIFTNAAGGLNLALQRSALVLISDHINLQGSNPLAGPNDDSLGPRFPDMSEAYSERYRMIAREAAASLGIRLHEGVYAALLGPSYETPAEIRYLRAIGADLVGMSTAAMLVTQESPRTLMPMWLAAITSAAGLQTGKISHEEVLETGGNVRETLTRLLKAIVPQLEV